MFFAISHVFFRTSIFIRFIHCTGQKAYYFIQYKALIG